MTTDLAGGVIAYDTLRKLASELGQPRSMDDICEIDAQHSVQWTMAERNPFSRLMEAVLRLDGGDQKNASLPPEPLSLDKTIKTRFAPTLRSDSFTGSGRTFRRVIDDMICVLHFQGSLYGGSFCIEIGFQPICIPDALDAAPDPKKLRITQCELRCRLASSGNDQWWPYIDQKSLDAAVDDASEVYKAAGRQLIAAHTGPDAPLRTATAEEFATGRRPVAGFMTTDVRILRTLALMRLAEGNQEEAKAFARLAIARSGAGTGFGLKRELEAIVSGSRQASE